VYDWALGRAGTRGQTDLAHWYPSATAQPWAIAFGLAPAGRWGALIDAFDARHPDWDTPDAVKTHDLGSPARIGYWPLIALAYARTGRPDRALQGIQAIKDHASGEVRVYPFTPAIAAGLILVETEPSVAALRAAA
ncbi:MAG: hypothetical protein ACRDJM_03005, partial [Actinomycetota bacterium]